ncbi:hypothetical protein [Haloferax gibbonsii]|uniref:Uncharacterized protein n=1 Tax=Haloferax gibbonsii TaxID=35746 RepID=A0A0K1IZN7_HALGI|nr:hypothetical protein [Haloferax gibbonsii]AKU09904.1 hypothetical protein ABY42_18985 [Haloferax gibbonsii]
MTRLIEKRLLNIQTDDTDHDLDPTYVDIAHVVWGVSKVLDNIRSAVENGIELRSQITQEYVDELEAAFWCGKKVINHEDAEDIKQDVSLLEDDILIELRGTIGYVAPHFGIALQLPDPTAERIDG